MKDYTGKTIFVGIDVHKKSYSVAVVCDSQVVKKDRMEASPDLLASYCRKKFVGATVRSAYEAGFCGFSLHRKLSQMGIDNRIVHPAGIEVAARVRVKTDKRDAVKIASQLSSGRLRGIPVPTEEREGYREISRLRDLYVKKKNRVGNQIKSLLHRHGVFSQEDDKVLGKKRIEKLQEKELREDVKFCLRKLCQEWTRLAEEIKEIEEQLKKQAEEDKQEKTYKSLPGVGETSARVLANELGDMSQFKNERQLFSYVGMTPREHSSGENRWLGHISRQGKSQIRRTLVQAAWKVITVDKQLGEKFEKLSKRAGKRRAIVAIGRILIGYARSCLRENRLYETRN